VAGHNRPVSNVSDPDLTRRRDLLGGVASRLRAAGIAVEYAPIESYFNIYGGPPDGVTGLICRHPSTSVAQVTVLRVRRLLAEGAGGFGRDGRTWQRDVDLDYRLDSDGDLCFEVTILEDPDAGLGHSRQTSAQRVVTADEQGAVDAVLLWNGYLGNFRCARPTPPQKRREQTRLRREIAARDAAAQAANVRFDAPPAGWPVPGRPASGREPPIADPAAVDAATLCWHFPRERTGRYARRAVVALAGYGGDPARRAPWLAVRAEGSSLVVGVEHLIGANQAHRWDSSPWLWSAAHADADALNRWQVPDAAHARAYTELLDAHELAEALSMASVEVDDDLARLLDGYPTRYRRARYTDAWVGRLYAELRVSAPWRFAAAYQIWQRERRALRRPADAPVVLFGLTGLNQASKPAVALGQRHGVPRLEMVWTASNARLPRALWERPPDLEAALVAPA
jgi:hypothetical protein